MIITSTRSNERIKCSKAILNGAPDNNGLYIFQNIDTHFFNNEFVKLNYKELTVKILSNFLDDYSIEALTNIVNSAYSSTNFIPDEVSINTFNNFALLSLFNGPTFAFKDMALSILPLLIKEGKKINNIEKPTLIITATSGDTGSAALSGFSQDENVHMIVLYPKIGISEFQEKQMNQFQSEKLKIYSIDGNFDDCQDIAKKIFSNVKTKNIILSSANSINIGRLVPQISYYFYSYFKLIKSNKILENQKINICVPSGNFGNIYAAYLAKKLGLPINKLIIASNQNNVLTELFKTGLYNKNRNFSNTFSPSMDILESSNFERYLFDLVNQDIKRVSSTMDELKDKGEVFIKEIKTQSDFYAEYANEDETLEEINIIYNENKIVIDPHTAVGSRVYKKYINDTSDNTYTLIVSTASPFKFSDTICKALNIDIKSNTSEQIKHLSKITNTLLDERILKVFNSKQTKLELKKNKEYETLKRMIGDIDDTY